ncbi:hypothetical protein [Thalassospira sp.]|uniref:hypothetical protein n=1 Tax=Thalassospira sp. TaxID=1912094 RepID=UPI002732B672|nr:hypothetical protein [Thalassospira sp.]MDP2696820.1 hypothetical protein [Thalassospira sp.]
MTQNTRIRLVLTATGFGAATILWAAALFMHTMLPDGGTKSVMPAFDLFMAVTFSLAIFGGLGFATALLVEKYDKRGH